MGVPPEIFIQRKHTDWERLSTLLDKASNNIASLAPADITTIGQLYRQATADLAVAQRDFPDHPVHAYLNDLVARAHAQVYRERGTRLNVFATFFTHTFPQAFRATWGYTLAAFLMFFLPALVAFVTGFRDPDALNLLIPQLQNVTNDIEAGNEWWLSINDEGQGIAATGIMTNNIGVAFAAFAGGITLGIYTLYILALNGIFIGSVAGIAQRFDFGDNLWGFVAAHGTVELSVIFIAGGAGLQLGWAFFRPGLYSRRAAVVLAAERATYLIMGCVPLLVIAGLIEGFISPSEVIPLWVKLFVSLLSGVMLYAYLLLSGHARPEHPTNQAVTLTLPDVSATDRPPASPSA